MCSTLLYGEECIPVTSHHSVIRNTFPISDAQRLHCTEFVALLKQNYTVLYALLAFISIVFSEEFGICLILSVLYKIHFFPAFGAVSEYLLCPSVSFQFLWFQYIRDSFEIFDFLLNYK